MFTFRPLRVLPGVAFALSALLAAPAAAQQPLPRVDDSEAAPTLPAAPSESVAPTAPDTGAAPPPASEPPPAADVSPQPEPPIQRPRFMTPAAPQPAPTPTPPAAQPAAPPVTQPPQPAPVTSPPAPQPAPPQPRPTPAPPPTAVAESPAPEPAPEPADTKPTPPPADADAEKKSRRDEVRRWRHAGFIIDLQAGFGGCTRAHCRSAEGHHAAPGARLGAFVGGNIFGIIEVGLAVGWNTLRPRDVAGRNALELYGLDPNKVATVIAEEMGVPALAVDLSSLTVASATSRAFDLGPSLRVHFIRKGRGIAYVGADIHYQLWRNRYKTAGGDVRLDFHGVSAPLRAGGGAYIHRNIAIVGEFNYVIAYFVAAGIHHPMLDAAAPLRGLEGQASQVATGLTKGMPHFWNLMINLRLRF